MDGLKELGNVIEKTVTLDVCNEQSNIELTNRIRISSTMHEEREMSSRNRSLFVKITSVLCLLMSLCLISCNFFTEGPLSGEDLIVTADTDGENYFEILHYTSGDPSFNYNNQEIIFFYDDGGGFWKVNCDGTDYQKLLEWKYLYGDYSVSPTQEAIVISDDYELYLYFYDDGRLEHLSENNGERFFDPSFSPDGSRILFYVDSYIVKSINSINVDDLSVSTILHVNSLSHYPKFSADMTKVFYKADSSIYMYDVDGDSLKVISPCSYDSYISTGGNYAAFTYNNEIYLYDFTTDELECLINGYRPILSNDGSKIMYYAHDSESDYYLYTINKDGSNNVKHKKMSPMTPSKYSFSSDGNKVCYCKYTGVDDF